MPTRRSRTRTILTWLVELAVLWVLWFVFVDQLSGAEALVGLGAAALAATGAEAIRSLEFGDIRPDARMLAQIWRVPGMVVGGCWVLAKALALRALGREVPGALMVIPFDAGGGDARSAGRRALAVAYTTLAPNSIVVRVDRKEHLMLIHQVIETDVPKVTRILGARA